MFKSNAFDTQKEAEEFMALLKEVINKNGKLSRLEFHYIETPFLKMTAEIAVSLSKIGWDSSDDIYMVNAGDKWMIWLAWPKNL